MPVQLSNPELGGAGLLRRTRRVCGVALFIVYTTHPFVIVVIKIGVYGELALSMLASPRT